jgi:hypothetical protein
VVDRTVTGWEGIEGLVQLWGWGSKRREPWGRCKGLDRLWLLGSKRGETGGRGKCGKTGWWCDSTDLMLAYLV